MKFDKLYLLPPDSLDFKSLETAGHWEQGDIETLYQEGRDIVFKNKLQKLEDALDEQMLTWLIRLTGLIELTMCKMCKM